MLEHYVNLPAHYYKRDHFAEFAKHFKHIPKDARLLNVGCGRGTSLLSYPNGSGVDFNFTLLPLWQELGLDDRCIAQDVAEGLPFKTGEFDWAVSTDFFEHIQPEQVEAVVQEVLRVSSSGLHVIDTLPQSGFRGPNGENLHPSANNTLFWGRVFERAGAQELNTFSKGRHFFVLYGKALDESV